MSVIKTALFFNTKAERDAAYTKLRPLFIGDDHGVSGDGVTADWQIWATYEGDEKPLNDALLTTITKAKAVRGGV